MKRCICVFLSFLIFSLVACSSPPTFTDDPQNPSVPGLAWGITKEDAFNTLGLKDEDVYRQEQTTISQIPVIGYAFEDLLLAGETITLALFFPTPEWVDKTGLSLGLIEARLLCKTEETMNRIIDKLNQGSYTTKDNVATQDNVDSIERRWLGINAYQAYVDHGVWESAQEKLITLYSLENVDMNDIKSLENPEEVAQKAAEDSCLSTVSYWVMNPEEDGYAAVFYYSGISAAILRLIQETM